MTARRATPSRSNLLATRRRLERVERGAELLRRKRQALVQELYRVARPALDAREAVSDQAREAWEKLLVALAARGADDLEALGLPERSVPLELTMRTVWGIEVPETDEAPAVVRSLPMRDLAPPTPGPAADQAATAFERLVERLIEAAPRELLLQRLGEQLARTSRQVNVLERRLRPALQEQAKRMERILEEREREDHLRLRHLMGRRPAGQRR